MSFPQSSSALAVEHDPIRGAALVSDKMTEDFESLIFNLFGDRARLCVREYVVVGGVVPINVLSLLV